MSETNHREPGREGVEALAYLVWDKEGRPNGRDAEDWSQAGMQLRSTRLPAPKRKATAETRQFNFKRFQAMTAII
jgi:hypothetical protein